MGFMMVIADVECRLRGGAEMTTYSRESSSCQDDARFFAIAYNSLAGRGFFSGDFRNCSSGKGGFKCSGSLLPLCIIAVMKIMYGMKQAMMMAALCQVT